MHMEMTGTLNEGLFSHMLRQETLKHLKVVAILSVTVLHTLVDMAEYYMASHLLALQRFPSCIQHLQLLNHRLFVYILLFFFEYLWSISTNQQTDKQEYFMYMTRAHSVLGW